MSKFVDVEAKRLLKKLKAMGAEKKGKTIWRKGHNAAGQIIVKAVRPLVPKDTGLMARSETKKVAGKGGHLTTYIGVDANTVATHEDGSVYKPENVDHLIEYGWQTPDGTNVPAVAPLRRGFAQSKARAEQALVDKAKSELEKLASK